MPLAVGEVVVDGWVLGLELELAGDGDGSEEETQMLDMMRT